MEMVKRFKKVKIHIALVIFGSIFFLFSPQPQEEYSGQYFKLTSFAGFQVNGDVYGYIYPAQFPSELLKPRESNQARPLFVLIGSALGKPTELVMNILGISSSSIFVDIKSKAVESTSEKYMNFSANKSLTGRSRTNKQRQMKRRIIEAIPYYIGFVLVNFLILFSSVLLFDIILTSVGVKSWIVFTLMPFLVFNDVVKAFIWTVHQQVFSIFSPLLLILLMAKIVRGEIITKFNFFIIGLLSGLLLLVYGNFIVFLPGLLIAIFYRSKMTKEKLNREVVIKACVLSSTFIAPTLLWISWLIWRNGSYFNYGMSNARQLVWILDKFNLGFDAFFQQFLIFSNIFFNTFSYQILPFIIAVFGLCFLRLLFEKRNTQIGKEHLLSKFHSLHFIVFFVFMLYFFFYWLLGYYALRLTSTLTTPLICFIALEINLILKVKSFREGAAFRFSFFCVLGWAVFEIVKYGPFV